VTYTGNEIECVSQYKYLGIKFCASGSFSPAQKELYSKALKVYYKLRRYFISFGPNVKNSIHVFDHTIKPILLMDQKYGVTLTHFRHLRKDFNQMI
jgi:hypothetical protein